ncbi:CTP-dependent riboflavin kinase [Candidatus Bathyarchaeota archaeon]|nr:CTP-dependent riboflavin kinase [Candidatus Bathyarchaeota archaeon]
MLIFKGKVVSGLGLGKLYITLPWVVTQIREIFGFTPYPGTLNLKVEKDVRKFIEERADVEIKPAEGFCRGLTVEVFVEGNVRAVAVIPKVIGYPEDLIELIAAENLRFKLNLKDGDDVTVQLP